MRAQAHHTMSCQVNIHTCSERCAYDTKCVAKAAFHEPCALVLPYHHPRDVDASSVKPCAWKLLCQSVYDDVGARIVHRVWALNVMTKEGARRNRATNVQYLSSPSPSSLLHTTYFSFHVTHLLYSRQGLRRVLLLQLLQQESRQHTLQVLRLH